MGKSRIYNRLTKTAPFEGYGLDIVEYPLQREAVTRWASEHLPSEVFAAINFSKGVWDALLSKSTPHDIVNQFDHGVLPEPPVSAWESFDADHFGLEMSERIASNLGCALSELVIVPKASLVLYAGRWAVDHLASSQSALVLIREMNPKSSHEFVIWSTPVGAFYPVQRSSRSMEDIADLMDYASSAVGEFAVLTSSDELDIGIPRELDGQEFAALLNRAAAIIIGAYDGESYIRWSRTV